MGAIVYAAAATGFLFGIIIVGIWFLIDSFKGD